MVNYIVNHIQNCGGVVLKVAKVVKWRSNQMIGAIIGDISGSRFERYNHKSKDFVFFDKKCHPTDDSIMSLAVAKAILMSEDNIDCLSENAISCMQELGRIYKNAGYGKTFNQWIVSENPLPYNSYGNGSAMRVSPCGFAAESIEKAKELSALVTKVSHDHPEGMKGAEAIAVAVYLAKIGTEKEAIRKHIENYYYDLDFTLQEIQTTYKFDVSCQGSVPVALEAFFESTDFEDAIRLAISVGGDSDTIAAMAGAVAEAYYGVPNDIIYEAIDYLDSREMEILYYFEKQYPSKAVDKNGQPTISVFDVLDAAVDKIIPEGSDVQVAEEFSDGSIRILVDNNMLQPDFTSFDNKSEDAIDAFYVAGGEVARAAKRASKGLLSAIKYAVDNVEAPMGVAVEIHEEKWYEIVPADSEDTEDIMYAVENLKANKYRAGITIYKGTMRGYVLLNDDKLESAKKYMEMPAGNVLELRQIDKYAAEKVKRYLK